ncbi:Fimbria adhesin EcpD [Thelohanellus kitauei]|uniref:Fimbria adhesin EcpD n=1 Tax=Thelohanellus kitauei TaxID=669202 RepID=A0A0C2MVI6_THEKT|nr:Fimbria adhesin EcpD [Thelohanellus kitauei]
MGYSLWYSSGQYFDMWITDSPIPSPFQGIRCMSSGSTCPADGYIAANYTDTNGFYHTKSGIGTEGNGMYGFASLSASAYEYFDAMAVGAKETYILNFCHTATDYDYSADSKCADLTSGATWSTLNYTLTKNGVLTLNGTGGELEIFVASDGTPSLGLGSQFCSIGVVSNVTGVICKLISYNLEQNANANLLSFSMKGNSSVLGFTPEASTVKYSPDGTKWYNYTESTYYQNVFSTSGEFVYVFLSNNFLKQVVDAGVSIKGQSPFIYHFNNGYTVFSGYYDFSPTNSISIVPKKYGISIISSDYSASPSNSGAIGDEFPIEFEYIVTTSGPRQADSITAQVTGDSTTINSIPYCLFTSTDSNLKVPIPAYLQYTDSSSGVVQQRNSCSEDAISLNSALWTETPWDASSDDGSYFKTALKLLFPMNDSRSLYSTGGKDWEGVVSASGEITVTATWEGVE